MEKQYDYLIVGAGLYGVAFAHRAQQAGKRCLVIDRRSHIGGNVYTEEVEGIQVHRYGAHIFHTSSKSVWDFVNQFVAFNRYTNAPVARWKDKVYNLPFNMNTFYQMWGVRTPSEAAARLEAQRAAIVQQLQAEGVSQPRNLEEQALLLVGRDVYERLIKGYTEKQWNRPCTELPAFIIRRLPLRFTYDNNYFNDTYQGIPMGGYTLLVERMLEGVEVRLGTDFFTDRSYWESVAEKIVFTGRIDEFFDYCFGALEYRSLRFETEVIDTPNYQGNAVVNYTEADVPYTRIIEHKHFEAFGAEVERHAKTVISREYPQTWSLGEEAYYPINDERNNRLYEQYRALAATVPRVRFGGRLGEYKYYDMAPIIARILEITAF